MPIPGPTSDLISGMGLTDWIHVRTFPGARGAHIKARGPRGVYLDVIVCAYRMSLGHSALFARRVRAPFSLMCAAVGLGLPPYT